MKVEQSGEKIQKRLSKPNMNSLYTSTMSTKNKRQNCQNACLVDYVDHFTMVSEAAGEVVKSLKRFRTTFDDLLVTRDHYMVPSNLKFSLFSIGVDRITKGPQFNKDRRSNQISKRSNKSTKRENKRKKKSEEFSPQSAMDLICSNSDKETSLASGSGSSTNKFKESVSPASVASESKSSASGCVTIEKKIEDPNNKACCTEIEANSLNNHFTKYFKRRFPSSTRNDFQVVSRELFCLNAYPNSSEYFERELKKYLRQEEIPQNHSTLKAFQRWIAIEIRERGVL
ncbi:hypothetical protein G9A89_000008 [Geosiphon pyriformis]|nr:hypothetical protein G9A89_000008 [Geosiphon pyriformis]